MSRWHQCASPGCDQLAHDYDHCDDCREARRQDKPRVPKQRVPDDDE